MVGENWLPSVRYWLGHSRGKYAGHVYGHLPLAFCLATGDKFMAGKCLANIGSLQIGHQMENGAGKCLDTDYSFSTWPPERKNRRIMVWPPPIFFFAWPLATKQSLEHVVDNQRSVCIFFLAESPRLRAENYTFFSCGTRSPSPCDLEA